MGGEFFLEQEVWGCAAKKEEVACRWVLVFMYSSCLEPFCSCGGLGGCFFINNVAAKFVGVSGELVDLIEV